MKRMMLTLSLLVALTSNTQEQETKKPEIYQVGRFVITHTEQGYQASTEDKVSQYQRTMFKSIKEIQ